MSEKVMDEQMEDRMEFHWEAEQTEDKGNEEQIEEPGISQYMNDINKIPRLTAEEEKKLIAKKEKGDIEAINILLLNGRNTIEKSVKKKIKSNSNNLAYLDDLISEGFLSYREGIITYDKNRGASLSTWCRSNVENRLTNETAKFSFSSISMSQDFLKKNGYYKLSKVERELTNKLGRTPTKEEIAKEMGISVKKRNQIILAFEAANDPEEVSEVTKVTNQNPESIYSPKECLKALKNFLGEKDFKLYAANSAMDKKEFEFIFQKVYPDKANDSAMYRWLNKISEKVEKFKKSIDFKIPI